jgi:hypothetical protein
MFVNLSFPCRSTSLQVQEAAKMASEAQAADEEEEEEDDEARPGKTWEKTLENHRNFIGKS